MKTQKIQNLLVVTLFCAAALGETNTQVKHYLMLGEDGYADQVTDDARTCLLYTSDAADEL